MTRHIYGALDQTALIQKLHDHLLIYPPGEGMHMLSSWAPDRLWGVKDVAACLDVPVQTVYQWRSTGYGPLGVRVGRYVRYRLEDVRAWVVAQLKASA